MFHFNLLSQKLYFELEKMLQTKVVWPRNGAINVTINF